MTSDDSRLLIHVGYHKTGSTFVQNAILKNDQLGFHSPWSHQDYIEELIICNPFVFTSDRARQFFQPEIEKAWQNNHLPVITHEMLSGNPWKGGYSSRTTAERLKDTFPEGKVLIVIREQLSMLLSFYKHRVRHNLTASVDRYLQPAPSRSGFEPLLRLEYLEYHWLIDCYQALFGKHNVLVLPYEMLRANKSMFLSKISDFSGRDIPRDLSQGVINPGYSGLTIYIKRWTNMLSPRYPQAHIPKIQKINNQVMYRINNLIPKKLGKYFDSQLLKKIDKNVGDFYRVSNHKTANMTGLDLNAYGYKV